MRTDKEKARALIRKAALTWLPDRLSRRINEVLDITKEKLKK